MNQQFQRIERLPPNVFNIIGELKKAARARGDVIIWRSNAERGVIT